MEEQTQAAHLNSIFEQAAQVEMLNQQLLVNPASALLLGLPQLGDLAQNPLAMLLAGAAQDPVPLPVPAATLSAQVNLLGQIAANSRLNEGGAGPSGRPDTTQAGTQAMWSNLSGGMMQQKTGPPPETAGSGKRKRTPEQTIWRKYGQKTIKGKETEGLDLLRCYYKCIFPGCPARRQVEKHSWEEDEDAVEVIEGTHNHPIQGEAPKPTLRIVQTRDPNTPRINNAFVSRIKRVAPFFTVLDRAQDTGEMRIVFASDNIYRATGYSQKDVQNKPLFFMAGPHTQVQTIKDIEEKVKGGKEAKAEILLYKRDGKAFWTEITVTPLLESSDSFCVAVHIDITKEEEKPRKRARVVNNRVASTSSRVGNAAEKTQRSAETKACEGSEASAKAPTRVPSPPAVTSQAPPEVIAQAQALMLEKTIEANSDDVMSDGKDDLLPAGHGFEGAST